MPKILLVEDDDLLRYITSEMLRDGQFEVVELNSADAALSYLLSVDDIDLVFTDINMPGAVDGLALARTVKAGFPKTKVVVTSGRPRSNDELGGLTFVKKPYHIDALLETIRSALPQPSSNH